MVEQQPPHFSPEHVQDLQQHEEIGRKGAREAKDFFDRAPSIIYKRPFASLTESERATLRETYLSYQLEIDEVLLMAEESMGRY